jgi:hypothetical protein
MYLESGFGSKHKGKFKAEAMDCASSKQGISPFSSPVSVTAARSTCSSKGKFEKPVINGL